MNNALSILNAAHEASQVALTIGGYILMVPIAICVALVLWPRR